MERRKLTHPSFCVGRQWLPEPASMADGVKTCAFNAGMVEMTLEG